MNLPTVESTYPCHPTDGYSWVDISKYRSMEWFAGFAYDWVTDQDIQRAIDSGDAGWANTSNDWQDEWEGEPDDEKWRAFHAARIGALAMEIRKGVGITPVSVDIMHGIPCNAAFCGMSYIGDGHHRIRALEFLGYKVFPSYVQGVMREIDKVLAIPQTNHLSQT